MRGIRLSSELIKFFSYHWCLLGIIGAILLPAIALFFGEKTFIETQLPTRDIVAICLRYLYLGQIGIVVASAGFFGQEYNNSALRTTLLAVSSRKKLYLSKKIVVTLVSIVACLIAGIVCFVISSMKYQYSLEIDMLTHLFLALFPAMISWVVVSYIATSLTVISKSLIVPIAILVPLFLGLSQMLLTITKLAKYLPNLAGMNIFLRPEKPLFLTVGLGIFSQLLWVIVFESSAGYLFLKRDVK